MGNILNMGYFKMQFIKEIPNFNSDILSELTREILVDNRPFSHSLLYDPNAEQKVMDSSLRSSEFRLFTEKKYFDLVQNYIKIINENDPNTNFLLLRNDLTHIRYQAGGFFKPHEDFLSFNSNMIEEYTMIMCLGADSKGGETIIHLNPFFKHISKATITTGSSLIFRKDLTHEGAVLESGTKEILTMNLIATAKNQERTVVVMFPNSKEMCLIPLKNIEQIPDNYLLTKLRFTGQLEMKNNLLYYLEEHSSAEEFKIVNKVFQKSFLTAEEIESNREILDYYQLNISNLMTRAIIEGSSLKEAPKPSPTKTLLDYSTPDMEKNMTVYADQAEFQYVLEMVKKARLPLVPFTMIWMEGGCNGEPTPLSVGAILFSEYNNMMYLRKLYAYHAEETNSSTKFYPDIREWIENMVCGGDIPNSQNYFNGFFCEGYEEDDVLCYYCDKDDIREITDEEKLIAYKLSRHIYRGVSDTIWKYDRYIERYDEINEMWEHDYFNSAINTDDENEILENSYCVPVVQDDDHPELPLGYVLTNNDGKFKLNFSEDSGFDGETFDKNDVILDMEIPNGRGYQNLEKGFNASLYLELVNPVQDLLSELFYDMNSESNIEDNIEYRRCHITIPKSQYQGKYYNLDENGKLGLEYRHLRPLMERIRETKLVENVKEVIPDMPLKNVQKDSYDAFMCNE